MPGKHQALQTGRCFIVFSNHAPTKIAETDAKGNETRTLSYPCDTYNDWQDNVRAIALSLQKLRDVARYGVFKYEDMVSRLALPSADGKVSTLDAAFQFLSKHSGMTFNEIGRNELTKKAAYATALKKLHPDKGGNIEDFHKLQEAKVILGI